MAAAIVTVVGFQIVTHIHWFRVHGMGSADGAPCPAERGSSNTNREVALANGVLRPLPEVGNVEVAVADDGTPDAGCGDGDIDLLIAVLGAPTERSRIGRQSKLPSYTSPPPECK